MPPPYWRKDAWIQNTRGEALAGAELFVCTQPADVEHYPPQPLAMVFEDRNGFCEHLHQPLRADGTGHFFYYAEPGLYTELYFYRGQLHRVLIDQLIIALP